MIAPFHEVQANNRVGHESGALSMVRSVYSVALLADEKFMSLACGQTLA